MMMNYIAFRLSDWLLTGPMKRPGTANPVSPTIEESAKLYRFFGDPIRFHLGFFIALGVAWLVYWFLFKTKWGFDLRAVGSNPHAARYAGMLVSLTIILAMVLSGALAGMAGANEVLGVNYNLAMAFSSGYGWDSIALALLGKSHPAGVVLSALLFGALRNGATNMQLKTDIPIDIISVLQAFILVFVAAPAVIRTIYRLKAPNYRRGRPIRKQLGRQVDMTTTALRRELEFVSPTRQRVMGILFLLAGVVIWYFFSRNMDPDVVTKFGMTPGGAKATIPNLVLPTLADAEHFDGPVHSIRPGAAASTGWVQEKDQPGAGHCGRSVHFCLFDLGCGWQIAQPGRSVQYHAF